MFWKKPTRGSEANIPVTSLCSPDPGSGFWYLVRVSCPALVLLCTLRLLSFRRGVTATPGQDSLTKVKSHPRGPYKADDPEEVQRAQGAPDCKATLSETLEGESVRVRTHERRARLRGVVRRTVPFP